MSTVDYKIGCPEVLSRELSDLVVVLWSGSVRTSSWCGVSFLQLGGAPPSPPFGFGGAVVPLFFE